MFNKLKNLVTGKDDKNTIQKSTTIKSKPYLHPFYDQRVNYNPEVDNSVTMSKLDAWNNKGDKQLERLKTADAYMEDGKTEQGLKIYHKIIVEDGLAINSQSYAMSYLAHLYKLERFDEAWGVVNQYSLKYPGLEKSVRSLGLRY